MKKTQLLFSVISTLLFLGLLGCASDHDENITPDVLEGAPQPTYSLDDAMYHPRLETWIVPQKDPYTLANFQKAYDNLSSGNTSQTLTRAQTDEFSSSQTLQATHYALKIYPKNEEEQWQVELMEDIKVAYIPFDYVQLPEETIETLQSSVHKVCGRISRIHGAESLFGNL